MKFIDPSLTLHVQKVFLSFWYDETTLIEIKVGMQKISATRCMYCVIQLYKMYMGMYNHS